MIIAITCALGAALCWAFGSLVSVHPAQVLGAAAFNRIRMTFVGAVLIIYVTISGEWGSIETNMLLALVISGFIGIFIGDTALFSTLRRMGPRRTAILFASNAPIATFLGFMFLDETIPLQGLAGSFLVIGGVVLAIVYGKRKDQLHQWEAIQGPLLLGVGIGLLAATAQAIGLIFSKPVLEQGADPIAASAVRVAIAAAGLTVMAQLPMTQFKAKGELTKRVFVMTMISGMLGMGIGMTLLMIALAHGETGVVATLGATSPVMMLPLIWVKTGERPAIGAWMGALAVVSGTGMIFLA